jgi:hypothetical protein
LAILYALTLPTPEESVFIMVDAFQQVLAETDQHQFQVLQEKLAAQFQYQFPDPLAPKTVIIVPSLSLDPEILSKICGHNYYEERLLCMLLFLRMPRTHIVYLSSMPIDEVVVDYYLHLIPSITGMHARKRLTLLTCYDLSNRSLTEKILMRPRLIEQIRQCIPPGHVAHLSAFNVTPSEEQLALRLGVPLYGCPSGLSYWGTKWAVSPVRFIRAQSFRRICNIAAKQGNWATGLHRKWSHWVCLGALGWILFL